MIQQALVREIVDERMANIAGPYSVLLVERLFERENAENLLREAAHNSHPTATPCPELGRYVEHHRHTLPPEPRGQSEVEVGRIDENRDLGLATSDLFHEIAQNPTNAWQLPNHLDQTHMGEFFGSCEAFKARRCYGATDNILLIVRCGDHLMGEEFTQDKRVTLNIKAVGTTLMAGLNIIRDSGYVYSSKPNRAEVELTWSDKAQVPQTTSYYYVRVIQSDGNLAWSSPMWVHYAP